MRKESGEGPKVVETAFGTSRLKNVGKKEGIEAPKEEPLEHSGDQSVAGTIGGPEDMSYFRREVKRIESKQDVSTASKMANIGEVMDRPGEVAWAPEADVMLSPDDVEELRPRSEHTSENVVALHGGDEDEPESNELRLLPGERIDADGNIVFMDKAELTKEMYWGTRFSCGSCGYENDKGLKCDDCGTGRQDITREELRDADEAISQYAQARRIYRVGTGLSKEDRVAPLQRWYEKHGNKGWVNWSEAGTVYITLADEQMTPREDYIVDEDDVMRRMVHILENIDQRGEKVDYGTAVESLGLNEVEDWEKKYSELLGKEVDDIQIVQSQETLAEFYGRLTLTIPSTGQPASFFALMEYKLVQTEDDPDTRQANQALIKELKEQTISVWKLMNNAKGSYSNRKVLKTALEMRQGMVPGGATWQDLDADDFDRLKNLFRRIGQLDEFSVALGEYVSLGLTGVDNGNPSTWFRRIGNEIFFSPWVKLPSKTELEQLGFEVPDGVVYVHYQNGLSDVAKLRGVVRGLSSPLTERLAFAMLYAADMPGYFGRSHANGVPLTSATRAYYYPIEELVRKGALPVYLTAEMIEDMTSPEGNLWFYGLDEVELLDKNGRPKKPPKGTEYEDFLLYASVVMGTWQVSFATNFAGSKIYDWARGEFGQIEYAKSGFGATGNQIGQFSFAAKAYESITLAHEGGKKLSAEELVGVLDSLNLALTAYDPWWSRYAQLLVGVSWYRQELVSLINDQKDASILRGGKVDWETIVKSVRAARSRGFVVSKGEAITSELQAEIDGERERILAKLDAGGMSIAQRDWWRDRLDTISSLEDTLNEMDTLSPLVERLRGMGMSPGVATR